MPQRRRPHRRGFLSSLAGLSAAIMAPRLFAEDDPVVTPEPLFRLSLAQWSLHRALHAGAIDHLDFARIAAEQELEGLEYVNSFFKDKAGDQAYLREMNQRAADHGVRNVLIMIDGEGALAEADDGLRAQAIDNHQRWIDAAALLGCHAIRVNAHGQGTREEMAKRAADSLVRLADYGAPRNISVIVENHGGPSSDGGWLASVMKLADHAGVGTLPDFGNFNLGDGKTYDRYQGVGELMPFAKAVSAKSYEFDAEGNEVRIDYPRMMKIVVDAGYRGFVGIEYEGDKHAELEGIRLTRDLLRRIRTTLTRPV